MRTAFRINDTEVLAGTRATIDLWLPKLNSHTELSMPIHVVHGKRDGPRLFVSAAIHGDEVNGVEIIRRLLESKSLNRMSGTLVAVPVVNVYGLIHESRYLPDRRDLNRSFPGSESGSLAARVAHQFMSEVVERCTHGIDLHTGAVHRTNLPQIRGNLEEPETEQMARVFGVPVIMNSAIRDGSLRAAAAEHGIPTLLYEAGQALRYEEVAISAGYHGVINVMRFLGMLKPSRRRRKQAESYLARRSSWERAPESGMLRTLSKLGAMVSKGQIIGYVSDPYSGESTPVLSQHDGVVIGQVKIPMVHEGEALFHIARFKDDVEDVIGQVDTFQEAHAASEDDRLD